MIDDLVGTLTDPIIVYPGGWGDSLPEWLKNAITLQRLTENMKVSKGEQPTGTDAEACAYLNTASLTKQWKRLVPDFTSMSPVLNLILVGAKVRCPMILGLLTHRQESHA
jgi:hypothetical protein